MLRNSISKKALAILLIFTLTSANFLFVGKSYATSFVDAFFASSDTGHKNVEFVAYFGNEDEKTNSITSDVNNEQLSIAVDLDVKDSGYLKDAKIEVKEAEEGKGLNFELGKVQERVEKIEDELPEEVEANPAAEEELKNSLNVNQEVGEQEDPSKESLLDALNPEAGIVSNDGQFESVEVTADSDDMEAESQVDLPEVVQGVEENVISLRQINNSSKINLTLPISFENERFLNENQLSKDCKVVFSGIYVDDDGDEIEVSKEIDLNVSWKDQRDVRIITTAEKYIDFGKGIILQTLVEIDSTTSKNTLPVKETEIDIDVPMIGDKKPSNVTVVANSLLGTNGQSVGEVNFDENNWNYNEEENKLNLKVSNEKQLVEVNNFENEYLKDADREIVEEERYYNESGKDQFLITYTYLDVKAEGEITLDSNINAKVSTFSGVENEGNYNLIENSNKCEYKLQGQTGEIVSLDIENVTEDMSKAYAYNNYNNNGKYEMQLISKLVANVSYKEIVEGIRLEDKEISYVDKEGKVIPTNDIYYKKVSVTKNDFDSILGEQGEIKILDTAGNEVAKINNETPASEDGNIVVAIPNQLNKLVYEISKPIAEGNIVINEVKAISNASIDKATLASIDKVVSKTDMSAKYAYVENLVEIGSAETNVKLEDTTTKANLVIDKDNLSTLANNEVELRVELNNANAKSDVYGNSVFEIELPEYVQNLQVVNASVLYGEGLDITNVEVNGRIIKLTVDGKQEGINSGVLTNGTNLVINANIKLDIYTPAKDDSIKLRYTNSEATNYEENGETELPISYSAPTGLVAVNSTFNYNNVGSIATSVRQGIKEDKIDIYSEAKVATMELVIMNNHENKISELAILGRVPFEGNKDVKTNEDLGTTLNTKLLNAIVPDERNQMAFNIYYSENGEATKDLSNESNGWTLTPENLENVKSYLIVPQDTNYEMKEAEILRFTYQYEVPANLTHNERIYGTFATYYKNTSKVAVTDEVESPDKVGLITGEGPEVEAEVSLNKDKVKEYEELEAKVVVKNTGNSTVEDINVEYPIAKTARFVSYDSDNEKIALSLEGNVVKGHIDSMEAGEEVEFVVVLAANKILTVPEYYKDVEGFTSMNDEYVVVHKNEETGEEEIEKIDESQITKIESKATVTAKDLGTTLNKVGTIAEIVQAQFSISVNNRSDIDSPLDVKKVGDEIKYSIAVENLVRQEQKNVEISTVIPEAVTLVKSALIGYEEDGITSIDVAEGKYNEETRTLTFNLDTMRARGFKQLYFIVKVNPLKDEVTKADLETVVTVKAEGTDTYKSNKLITELGKEVIVVNQVSDNTDTYIKEGDTIKYVFTVKNEGNAIAENVKLTEVIPDGITVRKLSYITAGIVGNKRVSSNKELSVMTSIKPGEELVVNVEAVASNLRGVQEKSITNFATVETSNIEKQKSNTITHIVEASEKSIVQSELQSSTTTPAQENTNINKTYKIEGVAWVDSNKDGARTTDEQILSGVVVRLVDSDTGVIRTSTTTDSAGKYTFNGIPNGNYLVIFEYDTVKYTVTAYKKDGVDINVNSDAIVTKLEQEGRTRNGAITDVVTVSNGSVSGIDIGLVLADTFNLKLDTGITKVITQAANKKPVTDTYENARLAKTEIGAKFLSGSVVYVEYLITVTNIGDVKGYAKQIVDYIPEGMKFNSSLEANSAWYTGTDGNLYSNALENKELASGESASIKLVLTKELTAENTGINHNVAEIYEDFNIYGISDVNSIPGNKSQGEDDMSFADMIISVKTGESLVYVSVIITTILLGSIVVFIAYNKLIVAKKKGGV